MTAECRCGHPRTFHERQPNERAARASGKCDETRCPCPAWSLPDEPAGPLGELEQARALLDAWCAAAEDEEALGPLREQTLGWLG